MIFHVCLASLFGVMRGVMAMTACGVRVVGCFFVVSALVVFSCFAVVPRGVSMVFCRVLVVFGCFLGHGCIL